VNRIELKVHQIESKWVFPESPISSIMCSMKVKILKPVFDSSWCWWSPYVKWQSVLWS